MKTAAMGLILAAGVLTSMPLRAQESVSQAVRRVTNGTMRLQFKARAGVCGSGRSMSFSSNDRSPHNNEWQSECEPGPVRVAMDISGGTPTALRFYVSGRWGAAGDATDVGAVAASDAGAWFVKLAETASGKIAKDAINDLTC